MTLGALVHKVNTAEAFQNKQLANNQQNKLFICLQTRNFVNKVDKRNITNLKYLSNNT